MRAKMAVLQRQIKNALGQEIRSGNKFGPQAPARIPSNLLAAPFLYAAKLDPRRSGRPLLPAKSRLAGAQFIEDVMTDHVHLLEPVGPIGAHVIGMIMRRIADIG